MWVMIDLDHYILSGKGDEFSLADEQKTCCQHYVTLENPNNFIYRCVYYE